MLRPSLTLTLALFVGCGGALEPRRDTGAEEYEAPEPTEEPLREDNASAPPKSTRAAGSCEEGKVEFRRDFCCPPGVSCNPIAWPGAGDPPCEVDCNRVCPGVLRRLAGVVQRCAWVPEDFTIGYRCGACSE